MTIRSSPSITLWFSFIFIVFIFPSFGLCISFCIFIASSISNVCPIFTASPTEQFNNNYTGRGAFTCDKLLAPSCEVRTPPSTVLWTTGTLFISGFLQQVFYSNVIQLHLPLPFQVLDRVLPLQKKVFLYLIFIPWITNSNSFIIFSSVERIIFETPLFLP